MTKCKFSHSLQVLFLHIKHFNLKAGKQYLWHVNLKPVHKTNIQLLPACIPDKYLVITSLYTRQISSSYQPVHQTNIEFLPTCKLGKYPVLTSLYTDKYLVLSIMYTRQKFSFYQPVYQTKIFISCQHVHQRNIWFLPACVPDKCLVLTSL